MLVFPTSQSNEASPFELLRGEIEPFSISSLPRLSPGSGEQVGSDWKVLDTLDETEKCLRDLRAQAAG